MGQIFDRYDVSVMSMERHTSTLSCHRHCHFMTVPAHFIHETGLNINQAYTKHSSITYHIFSYKIISLCGKYVLVSQ